MNRPSLLRNTIALLLSGGGLALLVFLLSLLIGRFLQPDGLGAYAVVFSWIVPIGLLVEMGLAPMIAQRVAIDRRDGNNCLQGATRFILPAGLIAAALVMVAAPLLSRDDAVVAALRMAAPLVLIGPMQAMVAAVLRGQGRGSVLRLVNLSVLGGQLLTTIAILTRLGDLFDIVLVAVGAGALRLLITSILYQSRYREGSGTNSIAITPLVQKGLPLALIALIAGSQTRVSVILLGWFAGPAEAGLYSAAGRFLEIAHLAPNAFFGAFLPAVPLLTPRGGDPGRLFTIATGVVFVYALIFGALLWWGAAPILAATYGAAFAPAGSGVLRIIAISLIPFLLRAARMLYWYTVGNEWWVNRVNVGIFAAHLIVGVFLIRAMGARGAALALLIVEGAACLLLLWGGPGVGKRRLSAKRA